MDQNMINRYGPNDDIKLEEVRKWRGIIVDRINGILVIDVIADGKADAKGLIHEIAAREAGCVNIVKDSCQVMRWTEMPDSWKVRRPSKLH